MEEQNGKRLLISKISKQCDGSKRSMEDRDGRVRLGWNKDELVVPG